MTLNQIKSELARAGLPAWAICSLSDGSPHVHFEELEFFCHTDAAAEIIKALNPEATDKGLAFTPDA